MYLAFVLRLLFCVSSIRSFSYRNALLCLKPHYFYFTINLIYLHTSSSLKLCVHASGSRAPPYSFEPITNFLLITYIFWTLSLHSCQHLIYAFIPYYNIHMPFIFVSLYVCMLYKCQLKSVIHFEYSLSFTPYNPAFICLPATHLSTLCW